MHMFRILCVGHVALVYILLHNNYPKFEKIKKGQLNLEHEIQGSNVVGKNLKPFIKM